MKRDNKKYQQQNLQEEKKEAWQNLLKNLLDRGLKGVSLVISNDKIIRQAVASELPGVLWQRCVVHFERNILAYVSREKVKEVAEDLREIFQVKRRNIAEVLIQEFIKKYRKHFPRAVEIFKQGIFEALTYLDFPASHQRHIKSTNMLERLFREIKRRTRVVRISK